MKLLNIKEEFDNEFFDIYRYEFDHLNTKKDIDELIDILQNNNYNVEKIAFKYINDDSIMLDDVEYQNGEDFVNNGDIYNEEYLKRIVVELEKNNIPMRGKIDIFNNKFIILYDKIYNQKEADDLGKSHGSR